MWFNPYKYSAYQEARHYKVERSRYYLPKLLPHSLNPKYQILGWSLTQNLSLNQVASLLGFTWEPRDRPLRRADLLDLFCNNVTSNGREVRYSLERFRFQKRVVFAKRHQCPPDDCTKSTELLFIDDLPSLAVVDRVHWELHPVLFVYLHALIKVCNLFLHCLLESWSDRLQVVVSLRDDG